MIEKVKGILINGRCFAKETPLSFFPGENDRIAIVYGKNGSGKSTISDGFSQIASGVFSEELSASLIDRSDNAIALAAESKIFVFNEKYIDENVKIDADGLGTIILLGGQVDLQADIDHYAALLATAQREYDAAESALEAFGNKHNPLSPDYHLARIKKVLQGDWAAKDSAIKGNKANSKVTEEVIKEIGGILVNETREQLQQKFDETKALLDKVADATTTYPIPVCEVTFPDGFEKALCSLLAKTVEKPVLTERESLILSMIQNGRQSIVEAAKRDFSDKATTVCPYCFREIDEEYRRGLIDSINKVLNKDVDAHKAELLAISFPQFSEDYSNFIDLDAELVKVIQQQIKACQELIAQYEDARQQKLSSVYNPLNIAPVGLESGIQRLNVFLSKLELKRQKFVDAIRQRKAILQELVLINKKIAHLQIEQAYRDYQKQQREMRAAEAKLQTKQKAVNETSEHLKDLEQKKSNVGLAIENINNALDYVFFSHGRLSIELKNNKYYLKSNGKDVKPKNVSLGERNIIALCYFFTQILSNQDIGKLYQDEELVVIDDPISSFDFENKVGISSFLRYQTHKIIKGNAKSKILFLTHDLSTFSDLQKIADEDCLVVYMLDIFDFNGSQIAGIQRHLGNKDLLLVVNKRDVLPKSLKSGRLLMWIRRQLKEIGLKPLDIILSSTKNKIGLDDVFGAIEHYRCQRNVYVVGTTNVGKSSLINHMLQAFKEEQDKPLLITTSEFPGTTLDIIEIPLGDGSYIYDTPGIINESQVTHYVSQKDLKLILPSSEIKQRVYQLNEKQTLFVGGLARFDFVKGDKLAVMCYFSNRLELHRTKLENAKDLFNRHQALKIEATNTDDMDSFKKYNFHLKNQRVDIVIEGLGWFSFQAVNHEISLHVPSGVGVLIRENLI